MSEGLERSIGQLEGTIKALAEQVQGMDCKLDNLPCIKHEMQICALEAWTIKQNGKVAEETRHHNMERTAVIKGKFSVKTALVYAGFGLLGAAIGILPWLISLH